MSRTLPVVVFAYARPDHLARTLAALRQNHVPLLHAYSDGPRGAADAAAVAEVRALLRAVDWCETVLVERPANLGLGRSILAGVGEVLERHGEAIVFEDDIVCAPGTVAWMSAALEHYRDVQEVMSVTAWTHPRVTPAGLDGRPFFCGRAEIWGWGTWARAWGDMHRGARELMHACAERGVDPWGYGADLPLMAEAEAERNLWGVRWLYAHLLRGGLCLYPPTTRVENVGFDAHATNTREDPGWSQPAPAGIAPDARDWPAPIEHPDARALNVAAYGRRPGVLRRWMGSTRRALARAARRGRLVAR